MTKYQIRNSLLLLITAIIWGNAFVAQSIGMDYVGPFTFNCARSLIGGLVLIPCIYFLSSKEDNLVIVQTQKRDDKKMLIIGGICCGIALAAGSSFQQYGILHTSVGKAGFITAFYIIIVPLLGLFLKKKCGPFVWLGVVIALAGLYFLCITESFTIGQGDIYVFYSVCRWSSNVLYSVFGLRDDLRNFYVCI